MDREQRTGFVELAATVIKLQVKEDGPFAMRGLLLYPEQTGVRIFDGAKDHLIISWDRRASERRRRLSPRSLRSPSSVSQLASGR